MDVEAIWMPTYTGKRVDLLRPKPEQIDPEDLAEHLSKEQRWVGACRGFLSVAQHAVIVAGICADPLAGLLHDAHEAYTGDLPRPVKHLMYREVHNLEVRLDDAICLRFGLPAGAFRTPDVREADERVAATEMLHLVEPTAVWMPSFAEPLAIEHFTLWAPIYAKTRFLSLLRVLLENAGRLELFGAPPARSVA